MKKDLEIRIIQCGIPFYLECNDYGIWFAKNWNHSSDTRIAPITTSGKTPMEAVLNYLYILNMTKRVLKLLK